MTRFEDEDWNIKAGEQTIKVFKIKDFRFSISTCFDVEFAALAIAAAQAGAQVLFAPSCTETMKGLNRVHLGFTDDGVLLQGSLNQADLFCYELDL